MMNKKQKKVLKELDRERWALVYMIEHTNNKKVISELRGDLAKTYLKIYWYTKGCEDGTNRKSIR